MNRNLVAYLRLVLGIPAVLTSSAALAQLQPESHIGTRIPTKPEQLAADKAAKVLAAFATCVVGKQRALASQFILDRTTLNFDKKYKRLADGNCLFDSTDSYFAEVGLEMGGDTMRYALSEALLKDELATIDPARFAQTAQLPIPLLNAADYEPKAGRSYTQSEMTALQDQRGKAQVSLVMYRFGECAVRADPAHARSLLAAAPHSADEGAALGAMMPAFGSCLEIGSTIKLNRERLRGAVAYSYYSLAHAPAAPLATPPASAP